MTDKLPHSRGKESSEVILLAGKELEDAPLLFFHDMSALHVLDLSYTSVNSLPQSISRLNALQKLILRGCDFLMELPPEIGELTNLEVIDLEGTEIIYLPKEIAKLIKLSCLKVSFYRYANKYQESKHTDTIIPSASLSNLSRLNELCIDVNPDGDWWDVEVKTIIHDLCSLRGLRTLKLYLPTTELLEELIRDSPSLICPALTHFRFIVGRQIERFLSCLPREVEEEFNNLEKSEKGLKYVNGEGIPIEIIEVLKHANAFSLEHQLTVNNLFEFGLQNMDKLKFCFLVECNELRTVIDAKQFYQEGDCEGDDSNESEQYSYFNEEKMVLGSLQYLSIHYMKNMESICQGSVGKGCLSNLKFLALHTCLSLTTIFTVGMLRNLANLELIVEDCTKISSLVDLKYSDSKSGHFLPNLKKILLLELPKLVSISNGLCIAPKLERMVIFFCPKLVKLSTMEVSSKDLKVIKGENEWWGALKWHESDLSSDHQDYLASVFVPLRRDGDLMAQFTKD
ncbi:Disease resistance protein RPS2 [Camellia lanceoleosa]|uniref:Disease resistance protein RPS2 n=1 Tax=Camellia lanceoleosa TaxID=1840588 RepID=A0ACC0IQC3_9ERIC|nr:Disease resistance protein RPS2 [Camellia lanceoleosa]